MRFQKDRPKRRRRTRRELPEGGYSQWAHCVTHFKRERLAARARLAWGDEGANRRRGGAMMVGQLLPAFIAQLLAEGVDAEQIERAVARTRDIKLGQSITGHPLRRSFAFEQAKRLERALD